MECISFACYFTRYQKNVLSKTFPFAGDNKLVYKSRVERCFINFQHGDGANFPFFFS
jgi:hypothetical protein